MNKLNLIFPGGAGGNWLSTLIYCLTTNTKIFDTEINYHFLPKSNFINLTHDTTVQPAVFLNGKAQFNIYLNVVKKLRIIPGKETLIDKTLSERHENLSSEACSKLDFLNKPIDLNYNFLYTDNQQFMTDLYTVLDSNQIKYTKNDNITLNAINKFKQTCENPLNHFNNYESEYWLGWCGGVFRFAQLKNPKNYNWGNITSLMQAAEYFQDYKTFFYDFTADKLVYDTDVN